MKIIDNTKLPLRPSIPVGSITVGTVFNGSIGSGNYCGRPSTYLRTYDEIVDLYDPNQVWHVTDKLMALEFTPVDATITIDNKGHV